MLLLDIGERVSLAMILSYYKVGLVQFSQTQISLSLSIGIEQQINAVPEALQLQIDTATLQGVPEKRL